MKWPVVPFPKRQRLVNNGGFLKFEALYCSLNMVSSTEILQKLSCKVQTSKSQVLNQFKSYSGFGIYLLLWTSDLVARHDDIGNSCIS